MINNLKIKLMGLKSDKYLRIHYRRLKPTVMKEADNQGFSHISGLN